MTSFWIALNSARAGAPSSSNSAVSTVVTTAPARSSAAGRARGRRRVREPTASAATWTSTPRVEQVVRRSARRRRAPRCRTRAPGRAREVEAVGARGGEDGLRAARSIAVEVLGTSGDRVAQAPRVLLGDEHRQAERRARPATSIAARRGDARRSRRRRRGTPPARRSTTSAARSRSSIGLTAAHQAPRHREGALAVGDRAGGDGQQHAAAQRAPGEAAVLRAALVAVLADRPTRRRGRPARGWPARRARSAASAGPSSARAGGHPLDEQRERRARRAARARCRARRTRSPGRSCPSAPARTGTSFSSRACGAWSVATQSIVAVAQPVDQRLAVGLGAQRRVHLHARVERRGRPRR